MSETNIPTFPTPPAAYIYGEDLRTQQAHNLEYLRGPHDPVLETSIYRLAQEGIDRIVRHGTQEGFDPSMIQQLADDEYGDMKRNSLGELRSSLVENGMKKVAGLDDAALGEWALQRYDDFMEKSSVDTERLEQSKRRFMERVTVAIGEERLPITQEQLAERLAHVALGYLDRLKKENVSGRYGGYANDANVYIGIPDDELDRALFHELLHAISGKRNIIDESSPFGFRERKQGLSHGKVERPIGSRDWLNEAVTDVLTEMLLDQKGSYDFGSTTASVADLQMSKRLKAKLAWDIRAGYFAEKRAGLFAMKNVPAGVLLRAYFAQDNDSFEDDPRAGTHAEKDLQRAIKIAGGTQAVKDLRVIERYFEDGKGGKAISTATRVRRERQQFVSKETQEQRRQEVADHTRHYQERIRRAKEYVATQ